MKIAIIGAGSVGSTLGQAWAKKGHDIFFGVRHPQDDKTRQLVQSTGLKAQAGTVAEAAAFGGSGCPVFRAYQRAISPSIANPRYAFFLDAGEDAVQFRQKQGKSTSAEAQHERGCPERKVGTPQTGRKGEPLPGQPHGRRNRSKTASSSPVAKAIRTASVNQARACSSLCCLITSP